ncbi:MAG: flagellar assembly protein FliW [Thiomonas sp.]
MTDLQPIDTVLPTGSSAVQLPTRFGPLPFLPAQVWTAKPPLAGFETLQRYGLISLQAERPFVWLQSLDDATVSFLLVQAEHFGLRYDHLPADATPLVMVLLPGPSGQTLRAHRQAPLLFDAQSATLTQYMVEADEVQGEGLFVAQAGVSLPASLAERVVLLR